MQLESQIEKKLRYVNQRDMYNLIYTVENSCLRGRDHLGRVLYVKQFSNDRELFQFLCGMCYVLEVL